MGRGEKEKVGVQGEDERRPVSKVIPEKASLPPANHYKPLRF